MQRLNFRLLSLALSTLFSQYALAQTDSLKGKTLSEVVINATSLTNKQSLANNTLKGEELRQNNTGQDMPYVLQLLPSVIASSDGGIGVGYTGLRVRGIDATRVNVTINGISYNDPESHGAFFVNLPNLAGSSQGIQLQRGVGTSTNGAAAFGASLAINTMEPGSQAPVAEFAPTFGPFGTFRGLTRLNIGGERGWAASAAWSTVRSNGYVERAKVDQQGFVGSVRYVDERNYFKLTYIRGRQRTYQAWFGIPQDSLATNRRHNVFSYPDQVDNYGQDLWQAQYTRSFCDWVVNVALHHTFGQGYYEEFFARDDFFGSANYSLYNLSNPMLSTGTTLPDGTLLTKDSTFTSGDIVRRRWLSNHHYGTVWSLQYQNNDWRVVWGGAANQYVGNHFGQVLSAQFINSIKGDQVHEFYKASSYKSEVSSYLKAERTWEKLSLFSDVQFRQVWHDMNGFELRNYNICQSRTFGFFNPKVGISYAFNDHWLVVSNVGIAHREPIRSDFVDALVRGQATPSPEQLINWEMGTQWSSNKGHMARLNAFYMLYSNQLINTGAINDVGALVRTNVKESYRAGLEFEGRYVFTPELAIVGNATASTNIARNFQETIFNEDLGQNQANTYGTTNLALSPSWIGACQLVYSPKRVRGLSLAGISKYVGEQYLDNTGNRNRMMSAYWTQDLRINYSLPITSNILSSFEVSATMVNALDIAYVSMGYVSYAYIRGGATGQDNWYFPQAGRHFFLTLRATLY